MLFGAAVFNPECFAGTSDMQHVGDLLVPGVLCWKVTCDCDMILNSVVEVEDLLTDNESGARLGGRRVSGAGGGGGAEVSALDRCGEPAGGCVRMG